MYSIILDKGIVVRDSDNKIVAPCQCPTDPDFVAYELWVNNPENQPTIYITEGVLQE